MVIVQLKPKKEECLHRFHPWVFSGAIQRIKGNPAEGEIVEVQDSKGNFLAQGHYQVGSIAVRVISFEKAEPDHTFWRNKISRAYRVRVDLGLINPPFNNIYRLIHGEGDGLSGLIVDVYDNTAVMQAHSVGMHQIRETLANLLIECVPEIQNVYYKSESTLPHKAPITPEDTYLVSKTNPNLNVIENGLQFKIDWVKGQKTGFFIDQRENRLLLKKYAKGRKVLNMFCYTGGFSAYALQGGAEWVHSVDSSSKAIDTTDENIEINFPNSGRHRSFAEDAFKFLDRDESPYDLIILDPPAFAKHRDAVKNALKGYKRLNAKALDRILPNGIVFTFSCSQAISKEQFRLAVLSAAVESGRKVRILHQLTQPADHPVNIYHPEGEYLKGLVLYVE